MKMKNDITIRSSAAEYLTYSAAMGGSGSTVELRYEDENIWLTQRLMAELYGVTVSAISQHLKTIFTDGELEEGSVVKKFLITAADGKQYNTNHYNLQAIIAVGFKVGNERAVHFRKWAGIIVKEFTIKGWVMDDERLKNGGLLTDKYFDQQLERIQEIRASERFRLMPTASARKALFSLRCQGLPLASLFTSLVRICNPHLVIFRISNPSSPAFHSTSDGNCSQRKCWRIANPDSISCWIANPTQRRHIPTRIFPNPEHAEYFEE